MKPKVFLTRRMPPAVMERLAAETALAWNGAERAPTRDELLAGVRGCEALFCTIAERVDAEVLAAGTALKVVANFGVGHNHIDVAAATARRIPVTNTPGVLTAATADIAFGLLLAAARRFHEGEALVRAGRWHGWEPLQLLGADLAGATLGLVGFGRIGQAMARRAQSFDLRVIYWNRTRLPADEEARLGVEYRERDALLTEADFVSLHVAYTPATHHLIDAAAFARMKPTAILVNTARGAVVDEQALVHALRSRQIAAAGLDVYEREPALEAGLAALPNCILLPHLGSATVGTRTRMGMMVVDNILAACAGRRPPHCVNPEVLA
jgi:glyoxylate reductase